MDQKAKGGSISLTETDNHEISSATHRALLVYDTNGPQITGSYECMIRSKRGQYRAQAMNRVPV